MSAVVTYTVLQSCINTTVGRLVDLGGPPNIYIKFKKVHKFHCGNSFPSFSYWTPFYTNFVALFVLLILQQLYFSFCFAFLHSAPSSRDLDFGEEL